MSSYLWLLVGSFIAGIFIYRDGQYLRKKGVRLYPGVAAGLVLFAMYVFAIVTFPEFRILPDIFPTPKSDPLNYTYYSPYQYRLYSSLVYAAIPPVLYLVFRFLKLRKSAVGDNPPLPPAPRWTFWLFAVIAALPLILAIALWLILLSIFRF